MTREDDSLITVRAPRSDEGSIRYGWSYIVLNDDGHTILASSDSGSFTYETEALALSEGWREAREAQKHGLHKRHGH